MSDQGERVPRLSATGARVEVGAGATIWNLAQPLSASMPSHPRHPRFVLATIRRHGDSQRLGGYSAATEMIVMCGHHGTHIDALAHVSVNGELHGGVSASHVNGSGAGLDGLDAASVVPMVRHGALLDIPRLLGVTRLEPGHEITLAEVEGCLAQCPAGPGPGDVVLFRTGWGASWSDPGAYYGADGCDQPGPGLEVARWLAGLGVAGAGADTIAFEHYVQGRNTMPVHQLFLYEKGMHIIENLYLEELAASGCRDFTCVVAPLPLLGATGSPIAVIAIEQQQFRDRSVR